MESSYSCYFWGDSAQGSSSSSSPAGSSLPNPDPIPTPPSSTDFTGACKFPNDENESISQAYQNEEVNNCIERLGSSKKTEQRLGLKRLDAIIFTEMEPHRAKDLVKYLKLLNGNNVFPESSKLGVSNLISKYHRADIWGIK